MQLPPLKTLKGPITAIIGGMPSPERLSLLKTLATRVDYLVVGGALANLLSAGQAADILAALTGSACDLILPVDVVVAEAAREGVRAHTVPASKIPDTHRAFDLGTDTIGDIARCIEGTKTLIWHGPLGAVETPPFDNATLIVARHAALLARAGRLKCHVSGGNLLSVLDQAGLRGEFTAL